MAIATIGLGFMLLIAGRPLYVIFTGAAAFLASVYLLNAYIPIPVGWNPLIVSAVLIAIGVGAGIAFRRFAAVIAAFIFGYYIAFYLPSALGAAPSFSSLILSGFVGAVCLVAAVVIFDISLVALSGLGGATMILQYLKIAAIPPAALFVILAIFAMITQFLMLQYAKPMPD